MFFGLVSVLESRMPRGGFDYGVFNSRVHKEFMKKNFDTVFLQVEGLRISNKTYYLPAERVNDKFDKSSWTILGRLSYAYKIFKYFIQ